MYCRFRIQWNFFLCETPLPASLTLQVVFSAHGMLCAMQDGTKGRSPQTEGEVSHAHTWRVQPSPSRIPSLRMCSEVKVWTASICHLALGVSILTQAWRNPNASSWLRVRVLSLTRVYLLSQHLKLHILPGPSVCHPKTSVSIPTPVPRHACFSPQVPGTQGVLCVLCHSHSLWAVCVSSLLRAPASVPCEGGSPHFLRFILFLL